MTRDEVLQMAIESGAKFDPSWGVAYNCGTETFMRFANLVEQRAMEECARICEEIDREYEEGQAYYAAEAIRATSTLKDKP